MKKLILIVTAFLLSVYCLQNFRDVTTINEEYYEEHETDEPAKFLEFHRGIRTRDNESSPGYQEGYKWRELNKIRFNEFARKRKESGRTKSNGVLEWKERGPANVPGRTRALYNVPGDASNNTWLAGSATGGIWRTSDGGATWSDRSADFPALPISSFSGSSDGSVIYAATGEFVSSFYSAIGNGIFKSVDGGVTWTQLPSTSVEVTKDFTITTRVITDPSNPDVIVATTVPRNANSAPQTTAIMRSVDGGVTWSKVLEIEGALEQIISTPGNFDIQYASQNGVGVWKSVDAGITWMLSNKGMDPTGRVELSVSPINPDVIFASAEGTKSSVNSDLYYSNNAGENWSLIDVKFNNSTVDFFEGQGFYDNTILADPFNVNRVYFGGVSLFRTEIGAGSTVVDDYQLIEESTTFLYLLQFSNIEFSKQRLTVGDPHPTENVEIRFGPGRSQGAHRFLVPEGKTSGVPANDYTYQDYVQIPFEVWDVTNNVQLEVSFRDQNRNGQFDLLPQYFSSTPETDYLNDSREYLYIQNLPYSGAANINIAMNGGHENDLMYNIFPALAEGQIWDPQNLPVSVLKINYAPITKLVATTLTVADGRNSFDGKNPADQANLEKGVHPDHHYMIPLLDNITNKTFRLLIANDGGVFVSKASDTPGITNGDWTFKGFGYNTSQFYGADKRPGVDQYIGGMQDNGTRVSSPNESANQQTHYNYAIGGDGFEVLWHSLDGDKILGTIYYGDIYKSTNAGLNFLSSSSGLPVGAENFPFVTKLSNSKYFPDRVFTVGSQGIYRSENFGTSWSLIPISENWIINSPTFLDIEVSRANPNVVWAGSGMSNEQGSVRNLYVSTDGGDTFTKSNNFTDVKLGSITKLATHPSDKNTAFALFSFAGSPKILRTTNLGQSWEDISGFGTNNISSNGFPDVAVYCLYVRPDNPNIIWAGTEIGIMESLDNGSTWAIIDEFPKVSVWDMKGQDDQVIIATHGRGIWTATIDSPQFTSIAPEIVAAGNSPQSQFVFRLESEYQFDSLSLYFNGSFYHTLKNPVNFGFTDFSVQNPQVGNKSFSITAYREGVPYKSRSVDITILSILQPANTYSTIFKTTNDIHTNMSALTMTGASSKSLHSQNPYLENKSYFLMVKTPVIVSSENPSFYIRDIAITEPGKDSVVIEGTTNGLDWKQIGSSYDATFDNSWNSAFSGSQPGSRSMFAFHSVDISESFKLGETVLFRARMISDNAVNAWGWAVNYVGIQEKPVDIEVPASKGGDFTIFPNPATKETNLKYWVKEPGNVVVKLTDLTGKTVMIKNLGLKSVGQHSTLIELDYPTGQYIVTLTEGQRTRSRKLMIGR